MIRMGTLVAFSIVIPKVNSGPILPPSSASPVPGRQLAETFTQSLPTGKIRDPHLITNARFAVGAAHFLEQWRGGRVVADVVKRLDPGLPLHIGLPGQNVDLQGFGLRCTIEGESCYHQDGQGHDSFDFLVCHLDSVLPLSSSFESLFVHALL